jgi:hypothetical protein
LVSRPLKDREPAALQTAHPSQGCCSLQSA